MNKKDTSVSKLKDTSVNDAENINNEDHGDPGFSSFIINESDIDKKVSVFISKLTRKDIGTLIDTSSLIIISPGPGVEPVYSIGNSFEDLLGISEILLFLSDSSALVTSTVYKYEQSKCTVLGSFPDGFYLKNYSFKNFEIIGDNINDTLRLALKNKTGELKNKQGYELLIKFVSKTNDMLFLNFITVERKGKLYIAVIDQRECGA